MEDIITETKELVLEETCGTGGVLAETTCSPFIKNMHQPERETQQGSASGWIYRAEGNRSLVIANLKEKIVYRLLKRIKREGKNKIRYDVMREKLQKGIDFVHYVVSPLIGRHLTKAGSLIELENGFANYINLQMDHQRPGYRRGMEVDPECPFAVRLPDHCLMPGTLDEQLYQPSSPTFSIEIKPKCGFLPDHSCISPESDIKCSVCRFCLHQYIKIERGKWTRRSDYCPLDLFSGNPSRMSKAIRSLFKTPQNNIRMFMDGQPIFSDGTAQDKLEESLKRFSSSSNCQDWNKERSSLNSIIDVLINCLLHVPSQNQDGSYFPEQTCLRGQATDRSTPVSPGKGLPRACVLGRVLQTQKLDNLDIEKIFPLYKRVEDHLASHPEDRFNWNLDGPFNDMHCWNLQNPSPYFHDDGSIEFAVKKIREFHVSRTAKDCSIMIAFQRVQTREACVNNKPVEETPSSQLHTLTMPSGAIYCFSVAVIDLDPKAWDKIPRYLKEDTEIVAYHKQFSHDIHGEYSRSPSTDLLITEPDGTIKIEPAGPKSAGRNGHSNGFQ